MLAISTGSTRIRVNNNNNIYLILCVGVSALLSVGGGVWSIC